MTFTKFETPTTTNDLNGDGLPVGRVLRSATGEMALVGHMNAEGGACDECEYYGEWVEYSDDLVPLFKEPA